MPGPTNALPDGFDPWEHLQGQYTAEFNRRVRRYFSDHDGDWLPNIADKRSSMRVACTIKDDDSYSMMALRMSFFFDLLGQSKKDLMIYYGSSSDIVLPVSNHPQLHLYFSQDSQAVPANAKQIDHEKTCRLTRYASKAGESLPAVTKANLLEIAREIKTSFMEGSKGITYTCGKVLVSYTDPANGFPKGNYWLVSSSSQANTLYHKLCNVIDRPFDVNKINVGTPEKDSTIQGSSGTEVILGTSYKKRAYRPVANLRFRHAYVSFGGIASPIFLVDNTNRHTALIT
ncbi:MAG: hypothetical protein RM347_009090 [Nostoc sp. ChiQUE02]|uniref:hypothetical protein n=1 Tax=Nostoc sp. ChiQUE02 TaxID=3075377 RepID=UPI002AD561CD|nr:hypothetical protein [Nostoc sp. ChiQUE02]MDZ8232896.1 hypothetical protein [Nostoc sp. ChiQUE02]